MDYPERMTYAQAVGEQPFDSPVFFAGVDFDPWDADEVEVVRHASQLHGAEKMRHLEEEGSRLRSLVETQAEHARDLEEENARLRSSLHEQEGNPES